MSMTYEYVSYTLNDLDNYHVQISLFGQEYTLNVRYNYTSGLRYINLVAVDTGVALLKNTYIREFDRIYIDNPFNNKETIYICLERVIENNQTDYHFWSGIFNLCVVPIDTDETRSVLKYTEKETI